MISQGGRSTAAGLEHHVGVTLPENPYVRHLVSSLPRPETIRLGRPITRCFATRALVLRFPEAADAIALASLAQALRHVLPVHLGVEEHP